MRSTNARIAKTVSICSDPVTENGPFKKKDEESTSSASEEELRQRTPAAAQTPADQELHAVAEKLVDDVVRLAAQAADEKASALELQVESIRQQLEACLPHHNNTSGNRTPPERLPSILIDTVPSMPPSPTEWPPPPPEATIIEEDETIEEEHPESQVEESTSSDRIQAYASTYIEDILSKAMELAEEKQQSEEKAMIREVASKVVDDVISRASESAAERLNESLTFPVQQESLPSIQIDTVASMPPSPEDNPAEAAPKQELPQFTFSQYEDDIKLVEAKALVKFSEAPEDVRELAEACVKNVVTKAITMAEEKFTSTVPFSFDGDMLKVNGPWYIRMREALMRVLRSACFCTPRRDDS